MALRRISSRPVPRSRGLSLVAIQVQLFISRMCTCCICSDSSCNDSTSYWQRCRIASTTLVKLHALCMRPRSLHFPHSITLRQKFLCLAKSEPLPANTAEHTACGVQCSHAGAKEEMQSLLQKEHCQSLTAWRLRWCHIMSPLQAALGHVKAFPVKFAVFVSPSLLRL